MASPLSLRRMRSYLGHESPVRLAAGGGARLVGIAVADFEAREPRDRDVLAQLGDLRLDQLIDGDGVVFHEGLLVQADLFVKLRHAAFHDLVGHLLRLAFVDGARQLDFLFLFERGGVTSSLRMNCGSVAAMCMAMSRTSSWKSSVRATKSDSQLTSTSTPSCAPAWI
jgi:hypothetical protein